MWATAGRWRCSNVVYNEGLRRYECSAGFDLEPGLDPMKNWTQEGERGERRVDVEADGNVRLVAGRRGAGEG
jgi:hypothetical protein